MKLKRWIGRWGSDVWRNWPGKAYTKQRYRQRLAAVQEQLAAALDIAPPGPVRIVSMCAGDGRDVIGVLQSHERRNDVTASLVELNPESVAAGIVQAKSAGLEDVIVFLNTDATDFATYLDIAPADIVLACGVWGHVPGDERERLVGALGSLCKPGGSVIWTRGISKGRQRLEEIESLFAAPDWARLHVSVTPDERFAVATYRYCGPAIELPASGRIFHFETAAGQ